MPPLLVFFLWYYFVQDPAGIFDLIEVVGNGTYGQVYKGTKINIFLQCREIFSVFSLFQYLRNSRDELHHLFYDLANLVAKFLSNFKEAHRNKHLFLKKDKTQKNS